MPRMRILTPAEQAEFDSPPVFNWGQKQKFFQTSEGLESVLDSLRTPVNTVGFMLSLGYFRAAKRFFGRQFHQQDVEYVTRKLGYLPELIDLECYEKSVHSRHRKLILEYLGFREFNTEARQEVVKEIRTMVRSQMRPKSMLVRAVEILEARKTEIRRFQGVCTNGCDYRIHGYGLAARPRTRRAQQLLTSDRIVFQRCGAHEAAGPEVPGITSVRCLPRIEGHQYFSICSITSSRPRAWLT